MNLLHLRNFYEAAKAGQVSAAAARLRVSQPAVSRMIRRLEDELGEPLLERTRKGVSLTEAGKIAFEHAGRIFAEEARLGEAVRESGKELRGEWAVGASDNLAIHVLPEVVGRMKERHPGLRIALLAGTSSHLKEEMLRERCDVGLFYTPLKASEPFDSMKVAETEFWIVVSARAKELASVRKPALADLVRRGVPRIESRHSEYAKGFPAHFHARRLKLHRSAPWLEANEHEIKKSLVLRGFGFALLTRHSVEAEVRSGKLLRVASPMPLPAPIFLVCRRGRRLSNASREFLRIFREKAPSLGLGPA